MKKLQFFTVNLRLELAGVPADRGVVSNESLALSTETIKGREEWS